jgi:hypothetical protein
MYRIIIERNDGRKSYLCKKTYTYDRTSYEQSSMYFATKLDADNLIRQLQGTRMEWANRKMTAVERPEPNYNHIATDDPIGLY